ncbi:hypothetical protein NDR89_19650 [Cupriavidus gilardii]|uniref:Ead/Ea22-like family protein n=1 Tax=Cupriavidus gilardii TaxID=82541 RepID=A0ABY4VS81_9BURK|nr:hypothetical protein [Cupriavidus gilardii]USE78854.1 hypothetical protein NDR89_19650 [Cupriavidus gilardii]
MAELNLDELESKAKAAGADAGIGAWEASDCAVWFPDGDGAMRVGERALVGITHSNLGAWPEMVDEEAVAEHIAAACPDTILALIARIRELERLNAVAYQNGFNDGRKSEDRYAKGWNDARRATDGQRAGVPEGWRTAMADALCQRINRMIPDESYTHAEALADVDAMLAAAPTPLAGDAGPFAGVSKVERESDFSVRLTFDSCRQASAFDRAAMAAMADSRGEKGC